MREKKGISLIVLVVTIAVTIVLSAAIILTLTNNNPIENAKKVAFETDMSALKEDLNTYVHRKIAENQGVYEVEELYADENSLVEDGIEQTGQNIKLVLPSINDKYLNKIKIIGGKLNYTDESNMQEYSWAMEVFDGITADYDKVESDNGIIQIDNAIENKLGNLRIYGNSIQNGTPTPDNPIEIQSVGELVTDISDSNYEKYKIPITVTGKNIGTAKQVYSGLKKSAGTANDSRYTETKLDGRDCISFVDNFDMRCSDINFKENTQYTFSFDYKQVVRTSSAPDNASGLLYIFYTDDTKEGINAVTSSDQTEWKHISRTSKANKTIKAIGTISYNYRFTNYIDINTFQIEEENKETDYEPYKGQTTNIYLNEPLRKVGDAVDYIDFKSKKVVRNVGVENLSDIRNSFHEYASMLSANGYSIYYNFTYSKTNNSDLICTHFERNTNHLSGSNHITLKPELQRIFIGINSEIVAAADKVAFREWLLNNNPKLFYVLNTPTEETIEIPEISTINGTNNISIGTSVNPSKMEVVYGK